MFKLLHTAALLLLILSSASVCASVHAATFTVTAGVGGNNFSPKTLTINAGDTVMFKNGTGFHNVVADDNSFTNGSPSSSAWTFSRTFNTAGTVPFYCSEHGGPGGIGMSGVITVKSAAPPPVTINGKTSGAWYNPQQSGQGFLIQTYDPNVFVAIWFVFTPDGAPQWVYGQGTFDSTSNTTTIPAAIYSGAKFPPNYVADDRVQTLWGNMTFTFTDCNNGTVSWSSTIPNYGTLDSSNNYSGSMSITRLAGISGYPCTP